MAVRLEFIDFIVPIAVIEEKYHGGWKQCLKDHKLKPFWHDEHLFKTGAMCPEDIRRLIDKWSALGFIEKEMVNGTAMYKDFCIVQSLLSILLGPPPCEWLVVDYENRTAYLKGTEPGKIIGREAVMKKSLWKRIKKAITLLFRRKPFIYKLRHK